MNDFMRNLRNRALGQMVAPSLRFFTPKDAFFEALEPYKHLRIIDAGTGCGLVPVEARARGFNMVGIDLMPRDGQDEEVLRLEAESFPYDAKTWMMVCRPSHDGWAYNTLEAALRRGASGFYVGLERNLEADLDGYLGRHAKVWRDVGEDGEHMFMFTPDKLLPADFYEREDQGELATW
jgi:hypothetical protein